MWLFVLHWARATRSAQTALGTAVACAWTAHALIPLGMAVACAQAAHAQTTRAQTTLGMILACTFFLALRDPA